MFNLSNSEACSPQAHQNNSIESRGRSYSETSLDSYHQDNKVKIPMLIMQTWKNHDIPKKWQSSPVSIQKYMPGWDYVLMTDRDNRKFVKKHFPDFLPYYDRFPHNIQRADAIRYMWLYVHGGIYMDLDFEVQYPLDDLFKSDSELYLVASGNVGTYLTNSFMASKPGCKVWLDMIEAMKQKLPWYYIGKHVEVMNSTGPIMLNHVVKKSKIVYSMLPSKLIMPCSICNIGSCDTSESYLKPLEGSSWISYDTKFYNFFLCKWKRVIVFVVFLLILILLVIFIIWLDWL
jgi:mannosyltransferase OCH1-like enzyme